MPLLDLKGKLHPQDLSIWTPHCIAPPPQLLLFMFSLAEPASYLLSVTSMCFWGVLMGPGTNLKYKLPQMEITIFWLYRLKYKYEVWYLNLCFGYILFKRLELGSYLLSTEHTPMGAITVATKSFSLNFLWSTVIRFLQSLAFPFSTLKKMSSTSCDHSTNKYELCFNIDFHFKKKKKTSPASTKALPRNVFDYEDIHCTSHWQSLGFFFAQTFCVSRQADVSFPQHSQRVRTEHFPSQPGLPKPPREASLTWKASLSGSS